MKIFTSLNTFLLLILTLYFLPGCTQQANINITPSLVIKPTQVQKSTSTHTATANTVLATHTQIMRTRTPAATVIPVPAASTQQVFEPKLTSICPLNAKIPFSELGIDPSFILFLKQTDSRHATKVFTISMEDITPKEVPNTRAKDGRNLYGFGLSPSKQWLELHYVDENETQRSIWFSSLDGQTQWKVIDLEYSESLYSVSDEEMVIIGVPKEKKYPELQGGPAWYDFIPLYRLNPFTGETEQLAPLPDQSMFDLYFTLDGVSYAIYHPYRGSEGTYFLFNYSDQSSVPVFQWLQDIEGWHYLSPGIALRDHQLFATILDRSYGFDMSIDLTFEEILQQKDYDLVMQTIKLPGGDNIEMTTVVSVQNTSNTFPVSRIGPGTNKGRIYFLFDYQNKILKQYCNPITSLGNMYYSPDAHFFAYSDEAPGTIILDTVTGNYARIDGYLSGDWGIQSVGMP